MRLKRALSQIKPSEGQKEKMYGDILEKLSEEAPEEEKETRVVMKKRKVFTSMAAALAAVVIVGGTVYAASPEVREMVRQVITVNPIPQYPVEGFRMLKDIGTVLPKNSVQFEDFPFDFETVYAVNAEKTGENSYAVEKIAYGNGNVIVLCNEDGSGFYYEQGQQGTVNIVADLSPDFAFDEGELSEVGYIFDGKATSLFNGRIGEEGMAVDFTAETAGEYEFYIINYSAGLQNYKSITVENKKSVNDYYSAYGNGDTDKLGNSLHVTDNDFTEFAEGIRVKLVSVVNSGSFAEVLLEFEFDKPIKDGEYVLEDVIISAYPKYLPSYTIGSLTVTDSGKIYGTVRLNEINKIPEDMTITIEIKTLDKAKSRNVHNTDETYGDNQSVKVYGNKVYGNFSADFALGAPIKPYSANVEPAEISWTHPRMGGETAHMEITALKYSPKEISVDLRMLEDCLVIYNDDFGGAQYFNNTQMFFDGIAGEKKAMPLKLKMSDGSLRDVWYSDVNSNAVNDIDKNTLVTDMDWIKACWDIYSDKPTVVIFQLAGIMDYTDVEAIVFCGKEIPIPEKDF